MKTRSQLTLFKVNNFKIRYLLLTFFFFCIHCFYKAQIFFCIHCFYKAQIFIKLKFSRISQYFPVQCSIVDLRPLTPFSCPVNLSTTPSSVSCYLLLLQHFRCTFGHLYLRVAHWRIKPSTDGKYSEKKIIESSRKQNLNEPWPAAIYIVFTWY